MRWLFNLAYLTAVLATLPWWLYKSATTGKYRRGLWAKFVGRAPALDPNHPVVWIHAVSVGEVLLLRPLLARLGAELPHYQLVLSTTTDAGYDVALRTYPGVPVIYAPLDFSWAVRRVVAKLQPTLLVLAELELWPNLLLEARRRRVPVAVVNARVSERSCRGYSRILPHIRPALAAIHWWGAQTQPIANRIFKLTHGLSTIVQTTGSIKYEGAPSDRNNSKTTALSRLFGIRPGQRILVAGSTQADENRMVLDVFIQLRRKHADLRLIVVPRHPEQFQSVADLIAAAGVAFVRRSELQNEIPQAPPVILVDSVGELGAVWGLADVGYVGGSMACGRGGQSMIEPAGYGVPVCFGPETWNFKDTVDRLLEADAAVRVENPGELLAILAAWLDDPAAANQVGERARRFIASQRGALEATARALLGLVEAGILRRSA